MGGEVPVPHGVLWGAADGGDQRVIAAVLDPHQGDLADVAGLGATDGDDDHRDPGVEEGVRLLAPRSVSRFDLEPVPTLLALATYAPDSASFLEAGSAVASGLDSVIILGFLLQLGTW